MKIPVPLHVKETFYIPSKSEPDKKHTVEVLSNGKIVCDCYASGYGYDCSHKSEVRLILKNGKLL